MKLTFLVISLLISSTALAEIYRQPVSTIKPLLLGAIKYGEAHGVLVGAEADRLHKAYKSAEPILIDVKAISTLPQKGCKRLAVTIKQDKVLERGSKEPKAKEKKMNIAFCENGDFPEKEGEVRRP